MILVAKQQLKGLSIILLDSHTRTHIHTQSIAIITFSIKMVSAFPWGLATSPQGFSLSPTLVIFVLKFLASGIKQKRKNKDIRMTKA